MTPAGALAEVPALPLHSAGKYVAGAYVVLFALVLIYVAIMAIRLSRIEGQLGELLSMAEHPEEPAASAAGPSPSADEPAAAQDPQRESTLA